MISITILGTAVSLASVALMALYLNRMAGHERALVSSGIGIAAMAVALILQSITESSVYLYVLFSSGLSVHAANLSYVRIEMAYPWLIAAFVGLLAGFWQEIAKLFSVRRFRRPDAAWIGLGFAVVDVSVFVYGLLLGSGSAMTVAALIGTVLQAPFSVMFHTGTAAWLRGGVESGHSLRNFLVAFLVHAYVDGSVAYSTIQVVLFGLPLITGDLIVWPPSIVAAVAFLIYLKGYLKGPPQRPGH